MNIDKLYNIKPDSNGLRRLPSGDNVPGNDARLRVRRLEVLD